MVTHRISWTHPPCDSDALGGEGFQLHILRWTIRSWDHVNDINVWLKCAHRTNWMSEAVDKYMELVYVGGCWGWGEAARVGSTWGVISLLLFSIDQSVTFTTEAANWKVLLLVQGQRVFNNASEPMGWCHRAVNEVTQLALHLLLPPVSNSLLALWLLSFTVRFCYTEFCLTVHYSQSWKSDKCVLALFSSAEKNSTECIWLCEGFNLLILTCFISGDGELIAGLTLPNQVLGKHADVVGGRRMKVDDGGLVELRGDVFGLLCSIPGGWGGKAKFYWWAWTQEVKSG